MTRGNQREQARLKNIKKAQASGKKADDKDGNKGMSLQERKQRDADRMREKQQKGGSGSDGAAGAGTSATAN